MSNISSESEDRMMSRDCINSPSVDDVSTERNMLGNGTLKKGPWTSAEDAILVDYVNKHGEGNWNAVQKHSGLSRCGKSCRLRWANHLRPDLKKGAFTPEEERKIIELHAKMGNKWARMAVELPGRTDNEIKNFWNTRTKRRQRAGLSIYPPDVCPQALNENTQTQNMLTFDTSHAEMLPNNTFQIPAVEFKNFNSSHEFFAPNILDLPGGNFLDLPGGSLIPEVYNSNFLFPIPKRDRRSDTCAVYDGDPCGYYPAVDQRLEISSLSGSHAYFNGNPSSSGPVLWAQKMELPSLQYSTTTQMGSCNAAHSSSPLPSLESVDTLIQQPVLIGQRKSEKDSGLLEAVLLQSQNLKMSKSNGTLNASVLPRDGTSDSSSQPDDDWEAYGGDPMSPLGHSAASVFSEYTPHLSGSSLDEHQSVEAISVKLEPSEEPGAKQFDREDKKPDRINFPRPDFLLGSNWFSPSSNAADHEEDRYLVSDPIRALLGEDFGCAFDKHISGSSPFEGLDYESSDKWDDISEICRGSGNC